MLRLFSGMNTINRCTQQLLRSPSRNLIGSNNICPFLHSRKGWSSQVLILSQLNVSAVCAFVCVCVCVCICERDELNSYKVQLIHLPPMIAADSIRNPPREHLESRTLEDVLNAFLFVFLQYLSLIFPGLSIHSGKIFIWALQFGQRTVSVHPDFLSTQTTGFLSSSVPISICNSGAPHTPSD